MGLGCGDSTSTTTDTGVGTLIIGVESGASCSAPSGGSGDGEVPIRDSDLDSVCVRTAIEQGENPFAYCDLTPEDAVTLTPGMVAAALARIPLPASKLQVQPPNGRTLVNFETNFFTVNEPFERSVTLLGQRVDLRIRATGFGWSFGDGESTSTTSAGSPYPDLEITHRYLHPGNVRAAVDTTYAAEFRVNGGAWADVPGSVTIAGEAVGVEVVTASPQLVGYE